MSFSRQNTEQWHRQVPGARWFKADLHVHTLDDHPGNQVRRPGGITGDPAEPATLASYATTFLRGVVRAGIQVLGLTPHSPRAGSAPDTSAVWRIVETWNDEADEDGVPFRDKIFAVSSDGSNRVTVKSSPDEQSRLIEHPAIEVASYVGRFGWVTITIKSKPTLQLALGLIDESYDSIVVRRSKQK